MRRLRDTLMLITDKLIWIGFLLLLVVVSLVNDLYSSPVWLNISAGVYILCALTTLNVVYGGQCNWRALAQAKWVILVFALILLLLFLQIVVPLDKNLDFLLFQNNLSLNSNPDWFQPASFWSVVPNKTRWLLHSEILMFSLFVLSVSLVTSRRRLKQLLVVIFLVGIVHAIIGVVAKFSSLTLVDVKQLDGHFTAARAWFINRNHFASFVSLTMVGSLAFQLKNLMALRDNRLSTILFDQLLTGRVIYPIGLLVALIAVVLSQSRAGFLALVSPTLLLVVFLLRGDLVSTSSLNKRKSIVTLIFILSVILVVLAYFGAELLDRFQTDALLGERVAQWSLTWAAIKPSWLLGYGGNSYADVFQIFRGYDELRQVVFNQAHNDYLHIWLEQGLLGLTLWLGLIGCLVHSVWTGFAQTKSTLTKATLLAVSVVLTAALLQSFVDFNLQILNIRYYFFVIMSLVFSTTALARAKKRRSSEISYLD